MRKLVTWLGMVLSVAACRAELMDVPLPDFEWFTALAGEGQWVHLDGRVVFTWDVGADRFPAAAELWGDTPGAVRPWRINRGTCLQPGPVVGTAADYPPFQPDIQGNAFAVTTVRAIIDPEATYHATVHLSPNDPGTVIACGNLNRVTGS